MKVLKVLVGCEESQEVTKAFRALGHEAYSCDLQEASGGHPEWHLQMDVIEAIKRIPKKVWLESRDNSFKRMQWDVIILHPPCTHIAVSGNRWYGKGMPMHHLRLKSVKWTYDLFHLAISKCLNVAMENPVGCLNSFHPDLIKPNYVQPYQFGHGEQKKTGFWLNELPPLKSTDLVEGREQRIWKLPPSADRAKLRSKTFPGIAKAMADQWSKHILKTNP